MMNDLEKTDIETILSFISKEGPTWKCERWCKSNELMSAWDVGFKNWVNMVVSGQFDKYRIKSASGSSGRWAFIPYCAILTKYNNSINGLSASVGFYPAYLLSEDCKRLYLTYMISSDTKSSRQLDNIVKAVRSLSSPNGFSIQNQDIVLGKDVHKYSLACIAHKHYDLGFPVNGQTMKEDLISICQFHIKYGDAIQNLIMSL